MDPEAPLGEYAIEIGTYDSSPGQRLPVFCNGQILEEDRVLLEVVEVVP